MASQAAPAAVSSGEVRSERRDDAVRHVAARTRQVSAEEAEALAVQFRLLGDPTRTRILYALLDAGELCVGHVAAAVEVSETAVSHALRLLRTAGIVRSRRVGRLIYYRLDDAHIRLLLDVSREHLRHDEGAGA